MEVSSRLSVEAVAGVLMGTFSVDQVFSTVRVPRFRASQRRVKCIDPFRGSDSCIYPYSLVTLTWTLLD